MGVYAVRNTVSGKTLVGASRNVAGRLNRERFQLDDGSHPSRPLQADWNDLGEDAFVFEVLDTLEPGDDPGADPEEDLAQLLEMWLDKLGLTEDMRYAAR